MAPILGAVSLFICRASFRLNNWLQALIAVSRTMDYRHQLVSHYLLFLRADLRLLLNSAVSIFVHRVEES